MISYILFFLLFIVPYILLPFGVTQFEDPKVLASEMAIIVMVGIVFFGKVSPSKLLKHFTPSKYLFAFLFLLTLFHLIFLNDQTVLFGNAFRLQGILLLWFMMIFSFISSQFKLPRVHWSVYGILLILEVVLMLFILPLNSSNRYVGTLGEPNATAALSLFVWPFIYFGIKKFKRVEKIGMALTFLLVIVILYFSQSRSAFVAFVIQLIFLFLLNKGIGVKKIAVICLTLLVISFVLPFFENHVFENRTEVWRSAVAANDSTFKLFFGGGFGNIENSLSKSSQKLNLPIQHSYVDSSHNIFLDWWVQGGVLGVVILFGLGYFATKNFVMNKKYLEMVVMLGLLVALSFNPGSISSVIVFWWLVGKGLHNYPAK